MLIPVLKVQIALRFEKWRKRKKIACQFFPNRKELETERVEELNFCIVE